MSDQKKDPLYYRAKLRCRALIAYGKSDEFIENELRNSFWPEDVCEEIIKELPHMRDQKIYFKTNVNLVNLK